MNRRRATVALSALVAAPFFAFAQASRKVPVIGFLHPGFAGGISGADSALDAMLAGLGSLGYIDGQTIEIEYRWAQGKTETLPALARELIKLKVDLIVAIAPSAVKAAMAATRELPIGAHDLETDPVAAGLASSLARPGGNLTGLFLNHADLAAKWLQQITEVKPGARHLAVLSDANTGPYQLDAIRAAAAAISAELSVFEFRGEGAIQIALAAGLESKPDAFVQLESTLIRAASKAIARILCGARPSDPPIEQPTHFEFLMNLKAAQAMTIKIPQSVLLRADEVIGQI